MKRDQKGRFTKEDYSNDSYELKLSLPTLKKFYLYYIAYYNLS